VLSFTAGASDYSSSDKVIESVPSAVSGVDADVISVTEHE